MEKNDDSSKVEIEIQQNDNEDIINDIESNQNNTNFYSIIGDSNNEQKSLEKRLIIDNIIYSLILIICGIILKISNVFVRPFFERDQMESFVPKLPNQVPTIYAFILSEGIPVLVLLIFTFLPDSKFRDFIFSESAFKIRENISEKSTEDIKEDIEDNNNTQKILFKKRLIILLWFMIGGVQVLFGQIAICNFFKILCGRHRPVFFYKCNYKGYADAIDSGNFTDYNANTVFGRPGSINDCLSDDPAQIKDAQMSFPSGHASIAFSGLFLLVLFLLKATNCHVISIKGLFCSLPIVLASWIAITRVQDQMHHEDDIFVGAFIGLVVAFVVFKHIVKVLETKILI